MKKLINILLVLVLSLGIFSLTACGEEKLQNPIYDTINNLLNVSYNDLIVTIDTENGGLTAQSRYSLVFDKETTITYRVERMNEFVSDGGYVVSESYKTVYEGSGIYKDGKLTNIDGDDVDITVDIIDPTKLVFNENCLSNAEISDTSFKATITDIDKFIGTNSSGYQNANVEVTFTPLAIVKIQIVFTTANNSNIKVTFMFNNIK